MAVTFDSNELNALLADVGACGEIGSQMGETLYKKVFVEGDVAKNYQVETGVTCGGYVVYDNSKKSFDALVEVPSCELPKKDISLSISADTWNPVNIGRRFEICYKDIAKGVKKILGDPRCEHDTYMPDAVQMYFEDHIAELVNNNIFARIWLGETAHAQGWLKGFNGFLIQAQANLSSNNKISLTQNAGASYSAQTVTPQQAYDYFHAMYWRAVELGIDDLEGLEIKATRELVNGYYRHVTANQLANAFWQQDGMTPIFDKDHLQVMGIPIKVMELNEVIKYRAAGASTGPYDNGTKYTTPNMAVLAPKSSLLVGTCNESAFKNINVWYNQDTRKQNFDVEEISLDAKLVAPSNVILLV